LYNEAVGDYSMPFVVTRRRFERWLLLPTSLLILAISLWFRNFAFAVVSIFALWCIGGAQVALYPDRRYFAIFFGRHSESSVCGGPLSSDERWILAKASFFYFAGFGSWLAFLALMSGLVGDRFYQTMTVAALLLGLLFVICIPFRQRR
jgi:hypothetical protein